MTEKPSKSSFVEYFTLSHAQAVSLLKKRFNKALLLQRVEDLSFQSVNKIELREIFSRVGLYEEDMSHGRSSPENVSVKVSSDHLIAPVVGSQR